MNNSKQFTLALDFCSNEDILDVKELFGGYIQPFIFTGEPYLKVSFPPNTLKAIRTNLGIVKLCPQIHVVQLSVPLELHDGHNRHGNILTEYFKLEVYGGSDCKIAFIREADETPDYISFRIMEIADFINYITTGS